MLKRSQMQIIAQAATECGDSETVKRMKRLEAANRVLVHEHLLDVLHRIKADRLARQAEMRYFIAEIEEAHELRRRQLRELKAEVSELKADTRSQMDDYAEQRREAQEVWQEYLATLKRMRTGAIE